MSEVKPLLYTRVAWRDGFDWELKKPTGRSLRDRGVMKAQQDGRAWFKLHYREEYVEVTPYSEALARKTLVLVEEFRGTVVVRSESMDIEIPVPAPNKAQVTTNDPDFF